MKQTNNTNLYGGFTMDREKMDIFALVDELEVEIEESPNQRFSKNKSVDPKFIMEIIDDIKNTLHDELDASRRIMTERDQILNAAERQASELIKRAKREGDELILQENVVKEAQLRASRLLDGAKKKAQEIRKSATDYAEEVFEDLDAFYRESIGLIELNRSRLYERTEPSITPKQTAEAVSAVDAEEYYDED